MPAVESNALFRVATRILGGEEQRRLAVYADMTMSRQADKDPLESCSGLTGRCAAGQATGRSPITLQQSAPPELGTIAKLRYKHSAPPELVAERSCYSTMTRSVAPRPKVSG